MSPRGRWFDRADSVHQAPSPSPEHDSTVSTRQLPSLRVTRSSRM